MEKTGKNRKKRRREQPKTGDTGITTHETRALTHGRFGNKSHGRNGNKHTRTSRGASRADSILLHPLRAALNKNKSMPNVDVRRHINKLEKSRVDTNVLPIWENSMCFLVSWVFRRLAFWGTFNDR